MLVQPFIHALRRRLGRVDRVGRADPLLRLADRLERPRGQECEDRRADPGHLARRRQHRPAQNIRVDLVERRIALRNPAAIDHSQRRRAVFAHPVENHARMEGRSLDGCEKLILRGRLQVPAQRDAAQIRIHQHGAVAVVPGQAQEAGLPGAIAFQPLAQFGDSRVGPPRNGAEDVSRG